MQTAVCCTHLHSNAPFRPRGTKGVLGSLEGQLETLTPSLSSGRSSSVSPCYAPDMRRASGLLCCTLLHGAIYFCSLYVVCSAAQVPLSCSSDPYAACR